MFKRFSTLMVATALTTGMMNSAVAASVAYTIDPTHTATVFNWSHFGFSSPSANFNNIQGTINYDQRQPSKSTVEVTIPVASVNTNVKALDDEFQKADWFNAEKYPNITFKSTRVVSPNGKNFKIYGDLTVKGITKPVVLTATMNKQGAHPMTKLPTVGFNATTSFNRSEFGIGNYAPNVSDKITVNITTEASAKN